MTTKSVTLQVFRFVIRLTLLAVIILLVNHALDTIPGIDAFNRDWIDAHTRNNGLNGIIGFIALCSLFMSVGAPRQLMALLGGYAFGFVEGTIYATLAAGISCAATFLLARLYAKPVLVRLIKNKIARIDAFLALRPITMTVVIRLLPVGNNLLTNLAAGVTSVRLLPFLIGSVLGYLPQMAVFALMGKGLVVNSVSQILISVVLFTLAGSLSVYLFKIYRAERLQPSNRNTSPERASTAVKELQ